MADNKFRVKTPTVFQMEGTECGAASLAMVLGYYGRYVSLEEMRIAVGVSRDGSTAGNIKRAATEYGLEAHGFMCSAEKLFEKRMPCIIFWNTNHFVVWEGINGNKVYVNDPGLGKCTYTVEEFMNHFSGIGISLVPTDEFKKDRRKDGILSFTAMRLKGQNESLVGLLLIGLTMAIPGALIPLLGQYFVDDVLSLNNTEYMKMFVVVVLMCIAMQGILMLIRSIILARLKYKLANISIYNMIHHMLRLPITFFEQRSVGDLTSRIRNNDNVNTILTEELAEAVLNVFSAIFFLIILFRYSVTLTLIGLVKGIISVVMIVLISSRERELSIKSNQQQNLLLGDLFSGLTISATLKASGTESEFARRMCDRSAGKMNTEATVQDRNAIFTILPTAVNDIMSILILIVGGCFVIEGQLTPGMLTAFVGLLTSFLTPLDNLANFGKEIQTMSADMEMANDIMKYDEAYNFGLDVNKTADGQGKLDGNISVENATFGYSRLKEPLIKDLSFHVTSGRSIAFVGGSGSGKSTVTKLVSGLNDTWSGAVRFDGVDRKEIAPVVLASSVGCITQDVMLFPGTVRDNLTLWNDNITTAELVSAAKDACIHDVIAARPGGYDYEIKNNGDEFSGGQRQRLEIARALASNPSILIMDEATSALDPITEKTIIDNIRRRGCTCIIIAHRLSAFRDCDEILVMRHGDVVERGNHEQLMAMNGYYKELVKSI